MKVAPEVTTEERSKLRPPPSGPRPSGSGARFVDDGSGADCMEGAVAETCRHVTGCRAPMPAAREP